MYIVFLSLCSEFVMRRVKVEERETEGVVNKEEDSELLLAIMEDYSYRDSAIQPLTELLPPATASVYDNGASSTKRRKKSKPKPIEAIQRERERRNKITEMFSVLQSVVPNLLPKATQAKIVTETIQFIRRLEEDKERLEGIKKSQSPKPMAAKTVTTGHNPAINVTVTGEGLGFFGIQLVFRRGLASEVFTVFEKYGAEVLAATATVNDNHQQLRQLAVTVTALLSGGGDEIEKIKREISEL